MPEIRLVPFAAAHLPQALALSRAEGWPHRAEDWALLSGLGRGVAALRGDRVMGTALAVPFGPVGLCSMILVQADARGQGLGRQLVAAAMATAAPQEWRLVATPAGMPLYRALGFQARGPVTQHQGLWTGRGQAADRAGPTDLDALAALDRAATGADRRSLLAALLAAGRIVVLRGPRGIAGYAALRPFGRGEVAGPVIAPDAAAAQALLSALLADRQGCFIRVDLDGDALGPWLAARGLAGVDTGIAMARGTPPPTAPGPRRFALAAQALG